jgi:hypothetical protein
MRPDRGSLRGLRQGLARRREAHPQLRHLHGQPQPGVNVMKLPFLRQ